MKTRLMSTLALTGVVVVAGCNCLCGDGSAKKCECETKATPVAKPAAQVVGLMTDQLVSPANIGATPRFSWNMQSARTGAAQTAYRVKLFEGLSGKNPVWDSGEVACGKSVAVKYGGPALKSVQKYVWTVEVKDEKGGWLKPAKGFFETGLFKKDDWNGAAWISAADAKVRPQNARGKQEAEDGTACFVKTIPNGKDVKEAYWTVAGLGAFEAYVNGEPVSRKGCKTIKGRLVSDFLKPGFTHNGKTKYSFAYDVTHLMKTGKADANTFAAQVSAGWWRDKIVNFFGKKSAFRAQLILRYADGTEKRIGTDTTWLSATTGPVLRAAIFDGEDYDARIKTDWMKGKPCDTFKPSEINTEFKGELFPMTGAPVRLREDIAIAPVEMYVWKDAEGAKDGEFGKVKKLRSYKDGDAIMVDKGETLVVDFGQNAAAIPCFIFSASEGVTLKMRPAEMLNDGNGARKRGCDGPEGSAYFTNYRAARTTLNYTFAGAGEEKYRPTFTFFGYRYASITTTDKVTIKKIRSIPVTSIPKWSETGCLETGVADVNKLISNVKWGQYSNYLSVPTDCPQRNERLGWTADTQVFTEAASYNANVYGFFIKWMRDMRDTQHEKGGFPGVAPLAQYGSSEVMRLGWSDAGVIVPYQVWKQFGDVKIIKENWAAMEKYMARCAETRYEIKAIQGECRNYQWADWLSYEALESCSGKFRGQHGPKAEAIHYWEYLGACYWLWNSGMMREMAQAMGDNSGVLKYRRMEADARKYLKEKFFDADGKFKLDLLNTMQTPALFALKLGLVEGEAKARMAAALKKNIADHGDCLQTGFLGTSILMNTLTYDVGAPDMAYTLLLQHKNPSWLYSVDQGATTIWERWNSYTKKDGFGSAGMNSFNHYAYGAVLAWMYGTMAGIQGDVAKPGFKHIILAPVPDKRVGHVKACFRSPYGPIKSAWNYDTAGKWTWTFTIPANTTATVTVPGEQPKEYVAGTYTVTK